MAAIHQATVEIITLQQADKDLKLSTLTRGDWFPEITDLISRTKIHLHAGTGHAELTYPTLNTKGIILGWFLKLQRKELQESAESVFMDPEDVDDVSEIPESQPPNPEEVDESYVSEAIDATSTNAHPAKADVYDAAKVEQEIDAEDEKLFERQRREFEVQHGRDEQSRLTGWEFYEGVGAPVSGINQSFLDMKLNLKTELAYLVRNPPFETPCILTFDPAISPYLPIDRTPHTGSRTSQG